MTFTFHHPSYYKKLKQNSGRPAHGPSKDNSSEANDHSNYGAVKVGKTGRNIQVGSLNFSTTHTSTKGEKLK
tara:strand:- start:648 stop:863 length:216 start_codon:yes stop_codon:yes gene_type:complete